MRVHNINQIKPSISKIKTGINHTAQAIRNNASADKFIKNYNKSSYTQRNTRVYSILLAAIIACLAPVQNNIIKGKNNFANQSDTDNLKLVLKLTDNNNPYAAQNLKETGNMPYDKETKYPEKTDVIEKEETKPSKTENTNPPAVNENDGEQITDSNEENNDFQGEVLPFDGSNNFLLMPGIKNPFLENSIQGNISTQNKEKPQIPDKAKPETEEPVKPSEPTVEEIFAAHPEVKDAYDKLLSTANTFSQELGVDGLKLIEDRIAAIGDGKVDKTHVLILLYLESRGTVYQKGTKNLIQNSNSKATGPFQIMPGTLSDLNKTYNANLKANDAKDNLDACIYLIRYIQHIRGKDIENGKKLPTGDNMANTIAWSYHDGTFAKNISYYGKAYVERFAGLNVISEYPQVVDYLFNHK